MYEVLNVDEIKNYLHSLVVLCETNVLSLISQRLDNYYQIQTKCYSDATIILALQTLGTKAIRTHDPLFHSGHQDSLLYDHFSRTHLSSIHYGTHLSLYLNISM
jgi:hypothetical protein